MSPKLWTFGWLGSWAQFTNRLVIHQAFLFLQWYSLCQFTLYIYFYCDPIENEITIYYENEVVAERWSYKRELSFSRLIVVPLFFKYFVGVRKENERLTAIPSNSIYNSKSLKEDDWIGNKKSVCSCEFESWFSVWAFHCKLFLIQLFSSFPDILLIVGL